MSYRVLADQLTFLISLLTFDVVTFLPNNEVSLKCEVNCKLSVGVGVLLFHSESEVVLPKPETGLEGFGNPRNT